MTERTFAAWLAPTAARLRESREELLELVRRLSPADWGRPTPNEGWTYKDILAHLASSDASDLHIVLRAVIARERVDPTLLSDPDARNARNVEERRGRSVEELIAELEADGEETQQLLSQLRPGDENLRQDDIPMSLGEGLGNDPGGHDREHLAHLRVALESVML